MQTEVTREAAVANLSDSALLKEVEQRLLAVTGSLISLAEVVGEVYRRGMDLPATINPILVDVLRKIDGGQIYPQLAERFMQHPIFRKLKSLPIDDQKRIAETGKVEIAVRRGDKFDTRLIEVSSLQKEHAKLAFDGGRIRSVSEQTAILESQPVAEEDRFDEAEVTVSVPLTVRERKLLTKKAQASGKATGEFIRDYLRSKKVI